MAKTDCCQLGSVIQRVKHKSIQKEKCIFMFVHYCETTIGIEVRNTAVHFYSTSSNEDEKFKYTNLNKYIHTLVHSKSSMQRKSGPSVSSAAQ